MQVKLTRCAVFLGLCALVVPILTYVLGRTLAGPYEGPLGLLGLIGHLYGDALRGRAAAWFLLTSPALLVAVWYTVGWLRRTRWFSRPSAQGGENSKYKSLNSDG